MAKKQVINMGVVEDYICPLCGETESILYTIKKKNKNSCVLNTYIWVCGSCPHISFESWDDEDLKNVNLFLSGKLKVNKEEENERN